MSLKATKEVLAILRTVAKASRLQPIVTETLTAAEAELEAIEKACTRVAGGYLKVSVMYDGDEAHRETLERIGEEASR